MPLIAQRRTQARAAGVEVVMLGRRSHARITIAEGAEGVLQLARAVGVSERAEGEWIATSREAGVLGETVTVSILDEDRTLAAQVVESKPVVTDGAVRHRLWLRKIQSERLVGAGPSTVRES